MLRTCFSTVPSVTHSRDLGARLAERGAGEIGMLVHSYNTMAGSLPTTRDGIMLGYRLPASGRSEAAANVRRERALAVMPLPGRGVTLS